MTKDVRYWLFVGNYFVSALHDIAGVRSWKDLLWMHLLLLSCCKQFCFTLSPSDSAPVLETDRIDRSTMQVFMVMWAQLTAYFGVSIFVLFTMVFLPFTNFVSSRECLHEMANILQIDSRMALPQVQETIAGLLDFTFCWESCWYFQSIRNTILLCIKL